MKQVKNLKELFDVHEEVCKEIIEEIKTLIKQSDKYVEARDPQSAGVYLLEGFEKLKRSLSWNNPELYLTWVKRSSCREEIEEYICADFYTIDYIMVSEFPKEYSIINRSRILVENFFMCVLDILEHTIESNKLLRASLSDEELNKEFEFLTIEDIQE